MCQDLFVFNQSNHLYSNGLHRLQIMTMYAPCLYVAPLSIFHPSPALIITAPSLCLTLTLPLPLSAPPPPPPSVSLFPLSAVSPLISPVQLPGRHMPSVCRASGDASCAGAPQSMHNRYSERDTFGTASRAR